jgi:hypothetical protein
METGDFDELPDSLSISICVTQNYGLTKWMVRLGKTTFGREAASGSDPSFSLGSRKFHFTHHFPLVP